MISIRTATSDDLTVLQEIERRAARLFWALGMDLVAEDDPPTLEHLAVYQQDERAWVAQDGGAVVGYLLLEVVAGAAHIAQVAVDPAHTRQRLGAQLIAVAAQWAAQHGLTSLTLTSFAQVPWNAPYYATLGFGVIPDEDQPPALRAIRRTEHDHGLDAWPRVAMRLELNAHLTKLARRVFIVLRPAVLSDVDFLEEMLVVAAFWRTDRANRSVAEVVAQPQLAHYVTGWPRGDDMGVIAEHDGHRVGAAWIRLLPESDPGYGFVDASTPELAIGVVEAWRGQGVGACLLEALIAVAGERGFASLSLSVEPDNPARHLYERVGFTTVTTVGGSLTMLRQL